jgi:type II secretory pathway component PulK
MGLKYPYRAKNSNFDVLEELLLIKGVNNNIFEKLKDYITIYGDGRVNINTASKPVLLALGLKDSTVDKILAFRSGEDEVEATCDDNVFDLMNNIVPKFSGFCFLSVADSAQLQAVAESYLCTTSNYFMIYSTAQTNNGRSFRHIVSVIDRLGNVFYWQQS